jgi:hypothetical protein
MKMGGSRLVQSDHFARLNHANVQAWDYRYTDEGDVLVQDDLTTPTRGEAYAYDGMHRLIDNTRGPVAGNTVPAPTFLQGWTLDKVGNWTTWNDNGANQGRFKERDPLGMWRVHLINNKPIQQTFKI